MQQESVVRKHNVYPQLCLRVVFWVSLRSPKQDMRTVYFWDIEYCPTSGSERNTLGAQLIALLLEVNIFRAGNVMLKVDVSGSIGQPSEGAGGWGRPPRGRGPRPGPA